MLGKMLVKPFLFLFVLTISSCAALTIPNTKVCVVAGIMAAGADCAYTLSEKTETMTLDQFLDFLEPSEGKAAALCQSADDWNKNKTALEQACHSLGAKCSYEVIEKLKNASQNIRHLLIKNRSMK